MDCQSEKHLLKSRSARKCIAEGYHLYMGSFRQIFSATWIIALLYAIVNGVYIGFCVNEYPCIVASIMVGKASVSDARMVLGILLLGGFAVGAVAMVLSSSIFSLLTYHRSTGMMPVKRFFFLEWGKVLRLLLWTVFLGGVVFLSCCLSGLIAGYGGRLQSVVIMSIGILLSVILLLALLPLLYPLIRDLTTASKGKLFNSFFRNYRAGLRHYGLLFVVSLIVALITLITTFITTLPAFILGLANARAQLGLYIGDPLGMPSFMNRLTIVVFVVASFIQAYAFLSTIFPLYYASGSIENDSEPKEL